jgi:pimeloyl-ACP methyl ester carboxylesterase
MKFTRRNFLSAASAFAAVPSVSAATQSRAAESTKRTTYVLVHGGGHGGWCWQRVAARLRAAGHDVYAPTLTGLGERSHLARADTDLDTHITDVVNVIRYEDLKGVILVGHSYGGMVITGVADRVGDRIAHLVFLDAAHPRSGQSLSMSSGEASAARWRSQVRTKNGVEFILNDLDDAQLERFGLSKPEDIKWASGKLTPQPYKTFTQPLHLSDEDAVLKIPRTSINRKNNQPARPPGERVWLIDNPGHDLMITAPEETTRLLIKIITT